MLKLLPYKPGDLNAIEGRAYEREMSELAGHDFSQVFATGPAFTLFADDKPVMAGGVVPHWKGRAEAWLHLSPWFERHPKTGYWWIKHMFTDILRDNPDFIRVEAPICAAMPKNLRLVQHLGFRKEGLMFRWGPEGRNYWMTALVRE